MFYLSLYLAKFTYFLIRFFKLGAGYTWPGHLALKIYPELFKDRKINLPYNFILITGTNGKTTTSKLISHILDDNGYKVVCNKSGANLLNGIASALLLDKNILGKSDSHIGVFEIDEYALSLILKNLEPKILVLLNLSRDQLDRYGEIDSILERWQESLKNVSRKTTLVVDKTQQRLDTLSKNYHGQIFYFDSNSKYLEKTKLVGDFNARNVNAAYTVASVLGLDKEKILNSLSHFDAAYGRGEIVNYHDKEFQLFLAKNPTSFNNNLEIIIKKDVSADSILFVLNDEVRDGRDVSWIYDVDSHKLGQACEGKNIFVSGNRCLDYAVRLDYTEVKTKKENIGVNLGKIINKITTDPYTKKILVFPNYSAMLQVREILLGREIL